ncbi:RNA polymerase sigma factor [Cohnella suwonensis]|uniref:RNA polymerase sigma factor n=1 Tax=Cohnella suwonensis TaxID=696072 RepID=A0ABW0LR24_9BACL
MIEVVDLESESFEHLKHAASFDDETFRNVMKAYGQDVWNYAFAMTRNRHDADDVVQSTFIKCHAAVGSFRGQSSFRTWLFAIARNTAFNARKTAYWRRVIPSSLLSGADDSGPSSPSAEQTVLDRLVEGTLWEKLLLLPPKYREPLLLDAVYELKQHEIAEVLGLSVGGVKTRLSRARDKMQKLLREGDAHDGAWIRE